MQTTLGIIAQGSGSGFARWSGVLKGTNISLDSTKLIATVSGNGKVLSNIGKNSGKWYWEVTITSASTNRASVGISTATGNYSVNLGTTATEWAYVRNGNFEQRLYTNSSYSAFGVAPLLTTGQTIGFALNMDGGANELSIYKRNSSGVVTLQGTITGLSGTIYAAVSRDNSGTFTYTANFGESSFVFSPPSGYNPGLYIE